jgi:hypothetical protein
MTAARFDISSRVLLLGVCAALAGCHHDKKPAEVEKNKPRDLEMNWKDQPVGGVAAGVAAPLPVKEGVAPLLYQTEQEQVIQVVDRTADQVLGQATVPKRTVVRVDERLGVIAGKEALFVGPLEKGHRYAIVVVPQGDAVSRSGRLVPAAPPTLEPVKPGAPTTQPAEADVSK